MADFPSAVLFCCTLNAVRSPIAEAILKYLHGRQIYVDSVGVRKAEIDAQLIAEHIAHQLEARPIQNQSGDSGSLTEYDVRWSTLEFIDQFSAESESRLKRHRLRVHIDNSGDNPVF